MKVPNECLYPTDVFLISCGMGCKRITVSDIAYIEAMKDNCVIHIKAVYLPLLTSKDTNHQATIIGKDNKT